MSALYTADSAVRGLKAEALATHNAKAPKYYLKAGDMYLHWSALKLTAERGQAWSGTSDQVRNCRGKFDAAAGCRCHPIIDVSAAYNNNFLEA